MTAILGVLIIDRGTDKQLLHPGSLEVMEILGTCDEVLKLVAAAVCKPPGAPTDLPEPPSKPLKPPDQPSAAPATELEEGPSVLPGSNVLTIATTD